LNENTINEIVQFATALDNEKNEIEKRIDRINESMKQIDFAPGRFLRLTPDPGLDVEVREFRAKLKSCTEDTLTGSEDDLYSERKFLQVKELIERFKRRPEHADEDLRWTRKVTDVRNWFQFGAEDKFRDTGVVNEYYQSTAGKSGGQKEVLAVTVLAASLAYQFGLAFGERASNAFRFVMLDEAFCRGTDESVHYGLSLLERLGLQVILVTPLQKLKAIEPHIARVGFVYNPSGKASGVKGMTLDEYVAEREKARTAA
jgi:uncharacterized protein YPO0396